MGNIKSSPKELVTLFQNHYLQLFLKAYDITGNRHDAEDLIQDVVLEILEKVDITKIQSLKAFTLSRIKKRGIDLLRKRKIPLDELDDNKPAPDETETQISLLEIKQTLDKLSHLAQLTEDQIILFNFIRSGLSNHEIADELKTDSDTIRKQKQAIMRKLRRVVKL